ncbi:MAG: hypothetical protein AB1689_12075, partial [Thermodesulfobacteriota bacterium]
MSSAVDVSFLPDPARITSIARESDDTRSLVLEPAGEASPAWLRAAPGQFVFLSLLGVGEAAFTISSWQAGAPPTRDIVLTVRRVGRLTSAVFALRPGDTVGVRGPFGRGFPDWPAHAGVTFVAGGCGLAPLRAAIEARIATRAAAAPVTVVYGAREPGTRIFRADLDRWRAKPGVTFYDCVERPDAACRGAVGDVCDALEPALASRPTPFAAVCGPPAMMSAVALRLARTGGPP